MYKWPHLPRSLDGSEQISPDLVSDDTERVSGEKSKVAEEHNHEDRAPDELIKGNLGENSLGIFSGDSSIQPVVEVVTRRSMPEKSKHGKGGKTLVINTSLDNEELYGLYKRKKVTNQKHEITLKYTQLKR